MRDSNTRALKPKKLQTATMKRRARKLKSIEVLVTKARSPQIRAAALPAAWHVSPFAAGCPDRLVPTPLPLKGKKPPESRRGPV
jgi:hypothetical protein